MGNFYILCQFPLVSIFLYVFICYVGCLENKRMEDTFLSMKVEGKKKWVNEEYRNHFSVFYIPNSFLVLPKSNWDKKQIEEVLVFFCFVLQPVFSRPTFL